MRSLKRLIEKGCKVGSRGLLAAALAVAALGLAVAPASAATVVVNTITDQALGSCSGSCSLRDAVATAAPGDTIQIPAGHYILTLGQIIVGKDLTISGAGARATILDGNNASRIFDYIPETPATISDVALVNGLGAGTGGALRGVIGPLRLERCLIANSHASGGGGGIYWDSEGATIDQCTFTGNTSSTEGGGILFPGGQLTISNSTLSGNTASGFGGGVFTFAVVSLFNVTITSNQASDGGGGLYASDESMVNMVNTLVAGNLGEDCILLAPLSTDHSLDSDNTCGLTGPGDLPGVNPLLGPLANNGGPTDTHALLAGSPALDAGNNSNCPPTDQRGVTRPQGPACDIGAFELAQSTPQDQIAALIAEINALVAEGALAPNKANPLLTKLDHVADKLDRGQTNAACGQLGAFINQVNAYIGNGTLTAAQG